MSAPRHLKNMERDEPEEFKRQLRAALAAECGNVQAAARRLGLQHKTMKDKIAKHGLRGDVDRIRERVKRKFRLPPLPAA